MKAFFRRHRKLRRAAKYLLFLAGSVKWRIKEFFTSIRYKLAGFSPKHILIIRTKGLGDIVRSLPAVNALHSKYPNAVIEYCTSGNGKCLLQYNPALSKLWTPEELIAALSSENKPEFDFVVNLHTFDNEPSVRSLMGMIKAPFIRGRQGAKYQYDENLYVTSWSELFCRLAMVRYSRGDLNGYRIYLGPEAEKKQAAAAQRFGLNFDGSNSYIGVVLGTDETRHGSAWARNYSVDFFLKLASELGQYGKVVLLGFRADRLPEEQAKLKNITAGILPEAIDLLDKPKIEELLYVIRNLKLLVTSDTGPLHLAVGLGVPVIALCGPTSVYEVYDPPVNRSLKLIQSPEKCSPCRDDFIGECQAKKRAECMEAFDIAEIKNSVEKLLAAEKHVK